MAEHFGDVLKEYVEQAGQSAGRLAKLTGIPRHTIVSWLEGRVKRPRNRQDIVKLAATLRLFKGEADRLLQAASHPSISELIATAMAEQDEEELSLISHWLKLREERKDISTANVAEVSSVPPFQALPNITNFVGRQKILAEVKSRLLERERICVLQGMGGVGKTALAVQLAYDLRPYFPDGVLWANLNGTADNGRLNEAAIRSILMGFARAYGRDLSQEAEAEEYGRIVHQLLANKNALISLDNAPGTEAVIPLLPPSTGSWAMLVTTRNRKTLRSQGANFDINSFDKKESLELFKRFIGNERVARETRGAGQIIDLLGGLPLAVKIVASDLADTESLTLLEYYDLLLDERSRLEHLTDWDDASKDVRTSFELSFRHLPERLRPLFILLAAFSGPDFGEEAVAAVAGIPLVQVKKSLGRLQALSLVEKGNSFQIADTAVSSRSAGKQFRYRLHPLLRVFTLEKLWMDSGMATSLIQRTAAYFIEYACGNNRAYNLLALDWENIAAALQQARQDRDWDSFYDGVDSLTAVNLGIVGFLDARGYWREAVELLEAALSSSVAVYNIFIQASMRFKLGAIAFRQADMTNAKKNLQKSLDLVETLPENQAKRVLFGQICEAMAQLAFNSGEVSTALIWSERGIKTLHSLDSPVARHEEGYLQIRRAAILARTGNLEEALAATKNGVSFLPPEPTPAKTSGLMNLGIIHDIQGNTEKALSIWEESVAYAQALGDSRREAKIWQSIGAANTNSGHIVGALEAQKKALDLYNRIGDVTGSAYIHSNLGEDYILLQDYESAQAHLTVALETAVQHKLLPVELYASVNQTRWHLDNDQLSEAETTLNQADTLCQKLKLAHQDAEIKRLQAELAYRQGKYELALARVEKAIELAANPKEKGLGWRLQGDIYGTMEKLVLAEAAYQKSQDMLAQCNAFECARTQLAWGKLHTAAQNIEKAKSLLNTAQITFEQLQMGNYTAATKIALGDTGDVKVESPLPEEPAPIIQSPEKDGTSVMSRQSYEQFKQFELLAVGGHGEVYRGQDTETGRQVVIKRLKPELVTQNPKMVARFLREAEALRQLNHPNIVEMLAAYETEDGAIIVMEYVAGGSLRDLLQKQPQLPLFQALNIALELADALSRTHHLDIIHRDLKPDNVLLAANGAPRLTDFGIAHMTQSETRLTQEGVLMGTAAYLSPEAFQGRVLDGRSDIWSFGVMLYEMLAGQLPFAGAQIAATLTAIIHQPVPDILKIRPDLPIALVALIERMLIKDPVQRIGRIRQVAAELEVIRDGV